MVKPSFSHKLVAPTTSCTSWRTARPPAPRDAPQFDGGPGGPALLAAATEGNNDYVQRMLGTDRKAEFLEAMTTQGTPHCVACISGYAKVVATLLRAGADRESRRCTGRRRWTRSSSATANLPAPRPGGAAAGRLPRLRRRRGGGGGGAGGGGGGEAANTGRRGGYSVDRNYRAGWPHGRCLVGVDYGGQFWDGVGQVGQVCVCSLLCRSSQSSSAVPVEPL